MMRNLMICAGMAMGLILAGCGEEPAVSQAPISQKVKAPPPAQEVSASPAAEEETVPAYTYDASGRKDPFRPLVLIKKAAPGQSVPLTPLQTFDLGQLKLVGIIVGKGSPTAMVIAPDGKSYILKKGIKVGKNDGTVVSIDNEKILVKEKFYDFSGEIRTATQEIRLPQREGVF